MGRQGGKASFARHPKTKDKKSFAHCAKLFLSMDGERTSLFFGGELWLLSFGEGGGEVVHL